MSSEGYWADTALGHRLSRRRAISLAGGAGAAAVLAACGGGSSGGGSKQPSSGGGPVGGVKDTSNLITEVPESTKSAVKGGIWADFVTAEPLTFDPMDAQSGALEIALNAYSQIVTFDYGTKGRYIDTYPPTVGDAAESWERSPDGLTLTFKLRPNAKFDPRPPTNGRTVEAKDWVYSWNAYVSGAPAANEVSNKIDSNAPIISFTATDSRTVVVKLAYPYVPILETFADWRLSFMLVPEEHAGKYNAKTETRGAGPFYLSSYVPSSRIEWRRNPNYWDAPRPYLDGRDQPIITEYAQRVAQLKAGNIWSMKSYIRNEDVLPTKKSNPKMDLYVLPPYRLSDDRANTRTMDFSWLPNSPFQDVRVRRATSMLIDYDGLNSLTWNLQKYRDAGIDIPVRYYSAVSAADDRFYLDPTDEKQIGEGAKNFHYNMDEATALMKAAGISGMDLPINIGTTASAEQQALADMLNAGGFWKTKIVTHDSADLLKNFHRGHGGYQGVAFHRAGGCSDPDIHAVIWYSKSEFRVWPDKGPWNDLLEKQRVELDSKKRVDIWHEIQKQWAKNVDFSIAPYPAVARRLGLAWPRFANFASLFPMQDLGAVRAWTNYWDDTSKV